MEQSRQEHHRMELVYSHPSGADEMYCPICGRRFLMQWPPKYKKLVLEPGDEFALHSAAKSTIDETVVPTDVDTTCPLQEENAESIDEKDLAPWQQWLDRVDFERLWGDEGDEDQKT